MINDLYRSPPAIALPSERLLGLFFGALFALLSAWFWYSEKNGWAAGSLLSTLISATYHQMVMRV